MDRLWSPWRAEYVSQASASDGGCIFCQFAREDTDTENLVVYRGEHSYIVLNRYPYNSGHAMIVPYEHVADFTELSPITTSEMMSLLKLCLVALNTTYGPDGYNAGLNLGAAAGAGVADHLHLHVVPRWSGDTNFMTTVGDIKVMPELLQSTYEKLAAAIRQLAADQS